VALFFYGVLIILENNNQESLNKKQKNRRKRYKKPTLLIFIAVCFILVPIFNTFYHSIVLKVPIQSVLIGYDWIAIVLMTSCVVTGAGLLFLELWSWYLFLIQASIIIFYNVYNIVVNINYYNLIILSQSLILFILAGYFLRRDVFAPFLSKEVRGFRKAKRRESEIHVEVDNNKFVTQNISNTGIRIFWADCPKKPGDSVKISFLLHSKPINVTGGITRIWNDEVSIAFRKDHENDLESE